MATIYDFTVKNNHNEDFHFEEYKDKVLLIVNTASKCGFTPQYEGLENLYQEYKDQGLVVIGFPCNQFGGQEPANDAEIASFCSLNYNITFPLMRKVDVNGKDATPLYQFLKKEAGGFIFSAIKWNFTKFLISRDAKTIKRFAPTAKPQSLEADIKQMLTK